MCYSFFLICQKGMPALLYQCENYLRLKPSLRHSTLYTKNSDESVEK